MLKMSNQLFFLLVCCMSSSLQKTHSANVTDITIIVPEQHKPRNVTNLFDNKIQMLVQNQTDYIKKIVSNEKEKKVAHPPLKKPSEDSAHKEITLEEYNNCRYLQLLFNETQAKNKSKLHPTKAPSVHLDEYKANSAVISPNPHNFPKKEGPVKMPNYFFITHYPSSTDRNVNTHNPRPTTSTVKHETTTEEQYFLTHTPNPKPHVKYVQYEPAILQKVVMDDGKVVFYRYNNPAISYYVPSAHSQTTGQVSKTTEPSTTSTEYTQPSSTKEIPPETPQELTTKIPNYEIDYGTPQKKNNSYPTTMKFIIPVSYASNNGIEASRTYPWYFVNTYPYYRNSMQRSSLPVPVSMPYVPIYNIIRTLTIPETYKK